MHTRLQYRNFIYSEHPSPPQPISSLTSLPLPSPFPYPPLIPLSSSLDSRSLSYVSPPTPNTNPSSNPNTTNPTIAQTFIHRHLFSPCPWLDGDSMALITVKMSRCVSWGSGGDASTCLRDSGKVGTYNVFTAGFDVRILMVYHGFYLSPVTHSHCMFWISPLYILGRFLLLAFGDVC